jgi:hypothetical protein
VDSERIRLTSQPISCTVADMTDSKPDALPDDVRARLEFATAAEALLRAILVALGYSGELTPADVIAALTQWVEKLRRWRLDPASNVATMWARAWAPALSRSAMAAPSVAADEATEIADHAVDHYVQRFPPLLEDASDDLEALREELAEWQAEAVGLRKIADAAEERADKGYGLHRELWQLVADVTGALEGDDVVASVERLKARAEKAEAELAAANAAIAEVARVAIVPQPKPESVGPNQRWARTTTTCLDGWPRGQLMLADGFRLSPDNTRAMLTNDDWFYLGPAPTTEGRP